MTQNERERDFRKMVIAEELAIIIMSLERITQALTDDDFMREAELLDAECNRGRDRRRERDHHHQHGRGHGYRPHRGNGHRRGGRGRDRERAREESEHFGDDERH